ncbi:hypothetical protein [Mesobacillus foraminis]|uniref:hypothetical protein n=1 Tax=Mesobacillus foraminis TaxID=279826 RepID=UPI0013CE8DDF|nr:hypothetical protein [Mesobacillus foraminis]
MALLKRRAGHSCPNPDIIYLKPVLIGFLPCRKKAAVINGGIHQLSSVTQK